MDNQENKQQSAQRSTLNPAPKTSGAGAQREGEKRQEEHHHAKEFGLILLAVVLLAAIGLGWWYLRGPSETVTELSPGVERRSVESGQIVPGFPRDLIREEGVIISGSYAIDYIDNNSSQPVVRYTSSNRYREVINAYGEYLENNDWYFIQVADPSVSPSTFYYADRDGEEVNITFVQNDNGTVEVNIAYLQRL